MVLISQLHLTVHCRPTHSAPLGRLHAIDSAAQTLPKTASTPPLCGAHCETVRRFSHTSDLLPVVVLRRWPHQQLDLIIINDQQESLIKNWPLLHQSLSHFWDSRHAITFPLYQTSTRSSDRTVFCWSSCVLSSWIESCWQSWHIVVLIFAAPVLGGEVIVVCLWGRGPQWLC